MSNGDRTTPILQASSVELASGPENTYAEVRHTFCPLVHRIRRPLAGPFIIRRQPPERSAEKRWAVGASRMINQRSTEKEKKNA